jgi:hypothetical protein
MLCYMAKRSKKQALFELKINILAKKMFYRFRYGWWWWCCFPPKEMLDRIKVGRKAREVNEREHEQRDIQRSGM